MGRGDKGLGGDGRRGKGPRTGRGRKRTGRKHQIWRSGREIEGIAKTNTQKIGENIGKVPY